jgi:phage terminase small subunit
MAILPSIDKSQTKRELTDKQQAFLDHLVDTGGDAKKAAELAGYQSHYHHVVKTLKSEILELTQEILANSAPKAAFKIVEIMESKKPVIAETFEKADEAAAKNGLIVVGELDSIYVDESDTAHGNVIPLKEDRTVH